MEGIFFEVHHDLPREAPGSEESTQRAYSMIPALPASPRILDVGCGPGAQSVLLARLSGGTVFGIDTHMPFLRDIQQRAARAGGSGRALPARMSMFELGFPPETFDLIWSEGAVYIRGFAESLRAFLPLLKPGGCVAVTEASWLRGDPPAEIRDYWAENYPEMVSRESNRAAALALGYRELGGFVLPREDWIEGYLGPISRRIAMLREKYRGNAEANRALDLLKVEGDLFPKYLDWFGYVFYILKKE